MNIGVLIFDGVEELDFVGPLAVFGNASRLGVDVETILIGHSSTVRGRNGILIAPPHTIENAPGVQLLIVPGGPGARVRNDAITTYLRAIQREIAAVCTGALLLGAAGVLRGHLATTHHAYLDRLRQFEGVNVSDRHFVVDGRIATAGAVTSGIDLALALVSRHWGDEIARRVAKNIAWPNNPTSESTQ